MATMPPERLAAPFNRAQMVDSSDVRPMNDGQSTWGGDRQLGW
jgi:hypothetical protein